MSLINLPDRPGASLSLLQDQRKDFNHKAILDLLPQIIICYQDKMYKFFKKMTGSLIRVRGNQMKIKGGSNLCIII
jgi:hypothetical protein